jgi:hypothetical protein
MFIGLTLRANRALEDRPLYNLLQHDDLPDSNAMTQESKQVEVYSFLEDPSDSR